MLNRFHVSGRIASGGGALWLVLGGLVGLGCPGPEPSSSNNSQGGGASGPGGASSSSGSGSGSSSSTGGVMNEGGMTAGSGGMGQGGSGGEDCGVTSFDDNPDHCGECFRSCDGQGVVTPICKNSVCISTCESGLLNVLHPDKSMPEDGCETPGLRVFVMEAPVEPIFNGELSDADALCQEAAESPAAPNAPPLEGTWRAWLVNSQSSPLSRFTPLPPDNLPIYRVDGEPVAANFMSMVGEGSQLDKPINVTESGLALMGEALPVWIGAATIAGTGPHCNDWSEVPFNVPAPPLARVGNSNSMTNTWTNAASIPCAEIDVGQQSVVAKLGRLYCFEQALPQ